MSCTGTETTTITNVMLNTLKLRRAPAKRLQHFSVIYSNIVGDIKKSCRNLNWIKFFQPSLSPFFPVLICIICLKFSRWARYSHRRTEYCTKRTQISVNQKRSQFSPLMKLLSFRKYSGISIFRTSKGKEIGFKNRFQKSESSRNEGKITLFDWGEGNNFWFELSGDSGKWWFENRDSSVHEETALS